MKFGFRQKRRLELKEKKLSEEKISEEKKSAAGIEPVGKTETSAKAGSEAGTKSAGETGSAALKKLNPHTIGILMVVLDSFCFSLMSVFVRLAGDVPTMQKTFFRNLVAAGIAIAILARSPEKFRIKKGCFPGLFGRAFFGTIGLLTNYWAIDHIALADANILNKMSPFFAIIVSIIILKEIPDAVEWVTIAIAFIGAAFIVKPTAGITSLPSLVGLVSGLGAGIAYTFVRKLGNQGERGTVIVAFFSIFSLMVSAPFLIADYHPMTAKQWLLLLLAGVLAAGGQFTITAAYRFAPAKEISVFDYSQVIFASLWGAAMFGEVPDIVSAIGYVIVIGTAIYRWHYNLRKPEAA